MIMRLTITTLEKLVGWNFLHSNVFTFFQRLTKLPQPKHKGKKLETTTTITTTEVLDRK
jgi:hypothetical protein